MKKKESSLIGRQEKHCPDKFWDKMHSALALSILLGFLLLLSTSIVLFVSFGDSGAGHLAATEEMKLGITPLGFDMALLVVIMFSGIIIVLLSKEKEKNKKEKAKNKEGV